jgi:hypothetical protein
VTQHEEEVELHAEALGVLRSLLDAATGTHCRESLAKAQDVLDDPGACRQPPARG